MPTPNYGWPYPTSASTVDVPRDIKALADGVDASLKVVDNLVYRDSGWIDLTVSFQANWQAAASQPCRGRRFGKIAMLQLGAQRVGAALTSDATGNFTDSRIFTCSDARFLPDYPTWFSWSAGAFGAHGLLNVPDPGAGSFAWLMQSISAANAAVNINQLAQGTMTYFVSSTY